MQLKRIGPKWYRGVRRHGLIMGCSVTARKPAAGPSPLELGPKAEASEKLNTNPLSFLLRVVLGSVGGACCGGCTAVLCMLCCAVLPSMPHRRAHQSLAVEQATVLRLAATLAQAQTFGMHVHAPPAPVCRLWPRNGPLAEKF